METAHDLAHALFERAASHGQAVVRCDASIPVDQVRAKIRALARDAAVSVRTGMVDDALAVARADASLWTDDTATMRAKLTAPDAVGEVS